MCYKLKCDRIVNSQFCGHTEVSIKLPLRHVNCRDAAVLLMYLTGVKKLLTAVSTKTGIERCVFIIDLSCILLILGSIVT